MLLQEYRKSVEQLKRKQYNSKLLLVLKNPSCNKWTKEHTWRTSVIRQILVHFMTEFALIQICPGSQILTAFKCRPLEIPSIKPCLYAKQGEGTRRGNSHLPLTAGVSLAWRPHPNCWLKNSERLLHHKWLATAIYKH